MNRPILNPLEIKNLINQYRSELRQLEFQVHKARQIIKELEEQESELREVLSSEESTTQKAAAPSTAKTKAAAPKTKETAGRKTKTASKSKTTGRRRRPKGSGKKKAAESPKEASSPKPAETKEAPKRRGRKPGPKKAAKKADTSGYRLSEWDDFVIQSLKMKEQALITSDFIDIAKENPDIKSGEAQIKVKLNRSLHKLANKKGLLVKVEHSGRGFAYGLADWVNNKGELPKKYAR